MEKLEAEGVVLRGGGGAAEFLPYGRVEAVAVGGIVGGAKPYLVLDLVLRPMAGVRSVLRFVSSQLDPVALTNRGDLSPVDAFRDLVRRIATAATAPVIPIAATGGAVKLATFPTVEAYEAKVLSDYNPEG